MGKTLTVVTSDGNINLWSLCKLVFLLILSSLAFIAALAVNEAMQKIIEKYAFKKDGILGYIIYAILAIIMVIVFAYIGCRCSPGIVEYINITP
jgi:membrane protease YdiL (CAAX protease family)